MTIEVASLVDKNGREGVETKWRESEEFHKKWIIKSRELLARAKFRNQTLSERISVEEKRMHDKIQYSKQDLEAKKRNSEVIKSSRDKRITNWRSFQNNAGSANATQ